MSLHPCTKTPMPCRCGNSDRAKFTSNHCCGAEIVCKVCGHAGPFVKGRKYEHEEAAAVIAWNEEVQISKED